MDSYRESIVRDEWLAEHVSDAPMVRWVLACRRAALAELLIRVGRNDEARTVVEQAEADSRAVGR